jgi:hypothetical protein
MNPNEVTVDAAVYSEAMELGVHVLLRDYKLEIEVESEDLQRALTEYQTQLSSLLRDIGARPAIGGCWFRKQSAFAGDPVYLCEQPKALFAKLSNSLKYDQVIDEVRKVRESVRAAVSPVDWPRLLREVGAQVESISSDRLFVKLAGPNGEGGAPVLRQLEKKVVR